MSNCLSGDHVRLGHSGRGVGQKHLRLRVAVCCRSENPNVGLHEILLHAFAFYQIQSALELGG